MAWKVEALPEVLTWLRSVDEHTQNSIDGAVAALQHHGPSLGRPLVDTLNGSRFHNLKELRPASAGRTEVRILFAFDPRRSAILLVGGDKSDQWCKWYRINIPIAERRYDKHLQRLSGEPR